MLHPSGITSDPPLCSLQLQATHTHTPEGRGFDDALIYFEHKNDYWNQTLAQSACEPYNPIVDLWSTSNGVGGPAYGLNSTNYEEYIFRDRVVSIINAAVAADEPLFLVYTPHAAHCPRNPPTSSCRLRAIAPADRLDPGLPGGAGRAGVHP